MKEGKVNSENSVDTEFSIGTKTLICAIKGLETPCFFGPSEIENSLLRGFRGVAVQNRILKRALRPAIARFAVRSAIGGLSSLGLGYLLPLRLAVCRPRGFLAARSSPRPSQSLFVW
jgi:hypothetical protein